MKCLFIYPRFTSQSFWNYRKTCELLGAKYPAAPLGLITVAALLPKSWEVRLVDNNVEELHDEDIAWADIVLSGGMIAQQREHIKLIQKVRGFNKTHVVGGPDATSSPHLYQGASHLVLGEAEVSMPEFLNDFLSDKATHTYAAGERKADMSTSPFPRFDLLTFSNYLHIGIQFARGCPFKCEFCDIIELFGRVPRVKSADQILEELQRLYNLGYRGHIDLVDDNFIGNKKAVKELLPKMRDWLEAHQWPFEFSTEASMNLADDEQLMDMMQEVGFSAIFVGIESPDEETLLQTQKKQNTRRSLSESVHKFYRHGMLVNAGYILGFDSEKGSIAAPMLKHFDETCIPVNMVGLLFALPNTQLSRRLHKEGRLMQDYEVPPENVGDQCLSGLNFETRRPINDILADYKEVVRVAYSPEKYFSRVRRCVAMLDCTKKRLRIPFKRRLLDIRGLFRLIKQIGFQRKTRKEFWFTFAYCIFKYPKAIRYGAVLIALYLHFGDFKTHVVDNIAKNMLARVKRRSEEHPTITASPQTSVAAAAQ